MKSTFLAIAAILMFAQHGIAQSRMHFYFNFPVNNSVSTGVNAMNVGNSMADTIVAYINKAQSTLDITQFEYIQSSSYANLATAINNAYSRGVTVRYIYDGSATNTGVSAFNSNIHTLISPTTSAYGIMHNKFIIIDANATNAANAYVLSGSLDWSSSMFASDYNNLVAIQDQPLAQAYTAEFNMMWGGTGATPNAATSKFGPYKTDLGRHSFTIDGHLVELYFSPSDNTDSHIQSTIGTANTDLYFGMYTFTSGTDANLIVARKNAGVYVAGIDDSYSNSYSPKNIFTNGLGSNFKVYSGSGIYHSKYMIVDPSDKCSDPLVLTGSHNWTTAANTVNDENTLIIHSDTVANLYYQSFYADFTGLGGTLLAQTGCPNAVPGVESFDHNVTAYPNPTTGNFVVSYDMQSSSPASLYVTDAVGRVVAGTQQQVAEDAGKHTVNIEVATPGIYFWVFRSGVFMQSGKLVKL